jgi:Macrocin-O-methyltransferase (TylF)
MSTVFSIYDSFLAQTPPDRLQKILARYELFKMVMDVPGDIVECGVFKGSGLFTWVKLMQIFRPGNDVRVVGFDFFGGAREDASEYRYENDKTCVDFHQTGFTAPEEIKKTAAGWGFHKLDLVPGNVIETTAQYAKDKFGARISLLYLDVDNYEGSLAILKNLYPLVAPGGIVAFDEYARANYGESDAVDEYFRGQNIRLRTIPWANTPTAYMVK